MVDGNIKLDISIDSQVLAQEAMQSGKIKETFTDALLDVADELQQESYRGATLDLAGSWDVEVDQSSPFTLQGEITNTSKRAINRVAGRKPGRMPPIQPLTDWVIAKGIATDRRRAKAISFAIARKIQREGTDRHKSGDNFLDLNPDGTFKPSGRIEEIAKAIAEKLSNTYK